MAIYVEYENKLREAIKQIAIMAAYAAGETIRWTDPNTGYSGSCNIKDSGAGLMWDWGYFEYKITGAEYYEDD